MTTFGSVQLVDVQNSKRRVWSIACEPHVSLRLKRVFGRIDKSTHGVHLLSDTPENARELEWFLERYPMTVTPPKYLASRAKEHREAQTLIEQLRDSHIAPPVFDLAIPAREYQRVAAGMYLAAGGLLLCDDLGLGKQQPVDAKVLTPSGYREIGSLAAGDLVIGSSGKPIAVTGVFPQGIQPSYRVTCRDGSNVEAGPEHLWTVAYYIGGRHLHQITVTTEQIRTGASIGTQWSEGLTTKLNLGKTKIYLPMLTAPVEFARSAPLPIDPYLMGQLIANGGLSNHNAVVTVGTQDAEFVIDKFRTAGASLGCIGVYGGATRVSIIGIFPTIRRVGLNVKSGAKFIPEIYRRASTEDRIALLHGLMDGDGSCSKTNSRVTYSTSSPVLARDIIELVEQLGGIASAKSYDRGDKGVDYSVRVRLPVGIDPFSLPRKGQRYAPTRRHNPTREIVSVEYVRDIESVCIRVNADDHLYATEHAMLTHNTASAICSFADPRTLPALVVTLTHLPMQWANEIARFAPKLRTHIIKKGTPYNLALGSRGKRCEGKHRWKIDEHVAGGSACMWCGVSREDAYHGRVPKDFPDVVIMNYQKLSGWAETIAPLVRSIVFDEAQELRRDESDKYKAAEHIRERVPYCIGLTGTPIYNYGGEIFNVLNIIKPHALGDSAEFAREWCESTYGDKPRIKDPKAFGLYVRDSGLMLRRTRAEVGREIPPVSIVPHHIDADPEALQKIESSAAELARIILREGEVNKGDKMHASEELSNVLRQATGIAKAPFVADFVRLLVESGEKIVLFGWHRACFARGTMAMMLDGTSKAVEDVEVGDVLMGPDSTPRRVVNLTRGHGKMWKVVPTKGKPFVCSDRHLLTLRSSTKDHREPRTIPAGDFASRSARFQRDMQIYRASAISFAAAPPVFEPWLMGYWLGDGAANLAGGPRLAIASDDHEVIDEVNTIASRYELQVRVYDSPSPRCKHYQFSAGIGGPWGRNRVLAAFQSLGLHDNKHIPPSYKTASLEERRQLLAGLVDSDGHVCAGNGAGTIELGQANERLANDIAWLARSLGLAAYVKRADARPSSIRGEAFDRKPIFRVWISGDITTIPTKVARKKPLVRRNRKNVLHVGLRVEDAGDDDFFGFEVDGDHLFLLDDFTVVHNCYEIWLDRLKDLVPVLYTGSEDAKHKEASRRAFVEGDAKVLIMSLRSGAGLDGLQKVCRTPVIGELDWSPGVIEQCIGRIARDGQTDPVVVYTLISKFGADPIMADVLGMKTQQIEGLRDPNASLIEKLDIGSGHIKRLAEAYLQGRAGAIEKETGT